MEDHDENVRALILTFGLLSCSIKDRRRCLPKPLLVSPEGVEVYRKLSGFVKGYCGPRRRDMEYFKSGARQEILGLSSGMGALRK